MGNLCCKDNYKEEKEFNKYRYSAMDLNNNSY